MIFSHHWRQQLLLLFSSKVKSIKFSEWNMGSNPDMNPVKVHIHVNRNNLGFEVRRYNKNIVGEKSLDFVCFYYELSLIIIL